MAGWLALAVAAVLHLAAESCGAVEPWAAAALPVTEGLQLWLDVGRQPQARQAMRYPPLQEGDALGMVLDASGQGRHLVQARKESQPRWKPLGALAAADFDGQDDCLALSGQKLEYANLTIFVVAAPRSNAGYFRAFFAMNQRGRNDYTSGITLDQSGGASAAWSQVNPEGQGFTGAVDLMNDAHPFGTLHTLSVVVGERPDRVALYVDGKLNGRRDRTSTERAEVHELTLGARFYSNTREPPCWSGFLDGLICELLVYDRALADEERQAVERYLADRYADAAALLIRRPDDPDAAPLATVENPPPVQFLAPGFAVRELPLQLTNINNLKYRDDGQLVALGYDGRIWLLSDTDGDRLEDRAEPFWDRGGLRGPIGMDLTPPNYPHGQGVFVASKGKLSLVVDDNGDDRADREIILADGWQELPHGVDALGVAVADDGAVFFGLGALSYTNPYLVLDGKARYDLQSERGTVLRLASDFQQREIYCTGIRFPVALAFNARGDLFATDQEGATWLPNGNPFDELLHLQRGRHYGFPPRHPAHLPGVLDEPSVFDYAPQHQSTCGLHFNPAHAGQPAFGPAWWRDEALVCGYSRGKIYRTQLVKTASGYVARSALLACLNALTVDACVSPQGELVIATHSGQPDWGTGPQGAGKLYKAFYADREAPQPVAAWSAGPQEVRIAFDRPLDPRQLQGLAGRIKIECGLYVRAGDRFESLRPGYQVVQDQLAAPRRKLAIHGVSLSADRATLLVSTAVHPQAWHYAMTLEGLGGAASRRPPNELPQHDAIELDYTLNGVEATWSGEPGESQSLWLPHLDLNASRRLTAASAEHQRFFAHLAQPGRLTLRTHINLAQLLRPAVQPGATIDYAWPAEFPTLRLQTPGGLRDVKALAPWAMVKRGPATAEIVVQEPPTRERRLPLEIVLETGTAETDLTVSYRTNEDARPRALHLDRLFVPWAPDETASEQPAVRTLPAELAGGDWRRGREVFHGAAGQCAACHQVDGQGRKIGPDLSNLRQRDYASVLRDITTPSAAINPEFISYAVQLTDGRVLSGAVRTEGDRLHVAFTKETPAGRVVEETIVAKEDVEALQPLAASIMPEGIAKALGEEAMKHLLTFLLAPPPEELRPAPIERAGAPPPRKRAEVHAALEAGRQRQGEAAPPLHILLVAGPKDHGINEHDYPQWQQRWAKLLSLAENVRVTTADVWPTPEQWNAADVAAFYSANPAWAPEKAKELDAFQQRGGGLIYLHFAVNGQRAPEELAQRIGLAWQPGSKFRHGDVTLDFTPAAGHPLVAGLPLKLAFHDETYWNLAGDRRQIHVLATAVEDGQPHPILWICERGRGRVFGSILGHYSWTFDDPLFRLLVLRAFAWTAHQPTDRLTELATLGARVTE